MHTATSHVWVCCMEASSSSLPGEALGLCVTCAACGALPDGVTQVAVADEGASGVLALPTQADVWVELALINVFKTKWKRGEKRFLSLKIRTIYSDQKRTHALLTSPEEDLVSILHIGLVMFLPNIKHSPSQQALLWLPWKLVAFHSFWQTRWIWFVNRKHNGAFLHWMGGKKEKKLPRHVFISSEDMNPSKHRHWYSPGMFVHWPPSHILGLSSHSSISVKTYKQWQGKRQCQGNRKMGSMCMWPGYPIPGMYISTATIFMRYHGNAPAICRGAKQMANSSAMVIVWLYFSYIPLLHLGNFLSKELLYLTLVTRAIKVMRPWLLSHEIFIKSSHVITYSEWHKNALVQSFSKLT